MEIQLDQDNIYRGKWGSMLGIGLGVFMGALDMSIINISLPTLMEQLGTQFATVQWVVIAYVLVMEISEPQIASIFPIMVYIPTG